MRLLCQIGLVALGSALGGLARWGATVGAARLFGVGFPWGTFLINVAGSFFLGWLMAFLAQRWSNDSGWLRAEDLRLLLAVGFTGAFTTFSTFEYESQGLLHEENYLEAAIYMVGSVFLGLVAVRLGLLMGRM